MKLPVPLVQNARLVATLAIARWRPLRSVLLALATCCLAAPGTAEETPPSCRFGPGDLPATTRPGAPHGAEIPIDHIVLLFQENHSYDNYLSHLRGLRYSPPRVANPDPTGGPPIRPFHAAHLCASADLDHSWSGSHRQWNGGAMDGFTATNVDPTDPSGSRTMEYYDRDDLPYYHALYRTFATSDRHFCGVLGPSLPNRGFFLAGTSFGAVTNFQSLQQPGRSIFEALDEAGISWSIYGDSLIIELIMYRYVGQHAAGHIRRINRFLRDAADGTLPQVSLIDPTGDVDDEHPPADVQVGQAFVARILNALMASPLWPRSAAILTYDEHGGYWDHVPPPPACLPDDIPPALFPGDVPGAFDRTGFRVPLVVVSPYAKHAHVSHVVTDHTSILRFIETRFDLPALTRRDANADALLDLFDFDHPHFLAPPRLPEAEIDPERAAECP